MVAGIDGAGTVLASSHPAWKAGDRVVHNGWGVGETRWGCLAERARLKGDWLVALPSSLSRAPGDGDRHRRLHRDAAPCSRSRSTASRPATAAVLVTGASGGVGSIAIALLARLGHRVAASTGRPQEAAYLRELGAAEIVERGELSAPGKPLQKERWAAAIDAVGSHTLANALAQTRYGGIVAACGLAQGFDLPGTVMPFILRGVTLAGIDSVMAPLALRQEAWRRLAARPRPGALDLITEEMPLDEAIAKAGALLGGRRARPGRGQRSERAKRPRVSG